jgi:hypothetical protein
MMAKMRLALDELSVESFDVLPPGGDPRVGTVRAHDAWGEEELYEGPTVSCNGTCQSCATGPCDTMCTGPATCVASCPPCAAEQ